MNATLAEKEGGGVTLSVYMKPSLCISSVLVQRVCIIGDFSVREFVLAFGGREEEEEARFPAGRPGGWWWWWVGSGRCLDGSRSLAALHYLSWTISV